MRLGSLSAVIVIFLLTSCDKKVASPTEADLQSNTASYSGSSLPIFGAETGAQSTPLGIIRAPYVDLYNYFGYVKPGTLPDALVNGKKTFYLYLWVPLANPEIGVRMISPWKPAYKKPAYTNTDFQSSNWSEGTNDLSNYFDTWISLERSTIADASQITSSSIAAAQWFSYGFNDDSSELPAQPSGAKNNSVLRVVSTPSDPLRALTRGLYRVGFTTFKPGDVQGTFLLQIGSLIRIPGLALAADPAQLKDIISSN